MARLGIIILPSSNYASRRIRCGVNEQTIEKGERTIYVATARRGRYCKPKSLLQAVVRVIRRGEKEKGWEPLDIATVLGLEVRLVKVGDKSLVMLGKEEIYLEHLANDCGFNIFQSAREVAEAVAIALHTTVNVLHSKTFPPSRPEDTRE